MQRRTTARGRAIAGLAVGTALALGLGACSGAPDRGAAGDAPASLPATTATSPVPTTSPVAGRPSTTAGPTSTTVATPAAGDRFPTPAAAVAHLHEAWRAGDRAAAALAAEAEAIDTLFALDEAELVGSECNDGDGGARCFMDGEAHSVIFEVAETADGSHRVTFVSIVTHDAVDEAPTAVASPAQAAVGSTVRLEGDGFDGEPWDVADAPLYLVGGSGTCALHAAATHTIVVDDDGRLSGEFVVPSSGDCRMADEQAAVEPGRYQLAYACTACFIGEIEVVG